jgi:hypothetical protein
VYDSFMEKYKHLLINGIRKNLYIDKDIINHWLSSLIEQHNLGIAEKPIEKLGDSSYSYVEENKVKIITYTSILNTGHIALRIYEEEGISSIHFDMLLSSPISPRTVLASIVDSYGMYDSTYMLLDRKEDFRTIDYRSYS